MANVQTNPKWRQFIDDCYGIPTRKFEADAYQEMKSGNIRLRCLRRFAPNERMAFQANHPNIIAWDHQGGDVTIIYVRPLHKQKPLEVPYRGG